MQEGQEAEAVMGEPEHHVKQGTKEEHLRVSLKVMDAIHELEGLVGAPSDELVDGEPITYVLTFVHGLGCTELQVHACLHREEGPN